MKIEELTAKIIVCAYKVYNAMGYGYLESEGKRKLYLLNPVNPVILSNFFNNYSAVYHSAKDNPLC